MTDASGRRQWLLLGSVTAMIMASHRSQPRSAPRVGYGIPTSLLCRKMPTAVSVASDAAVDSRKTSKRRPLALHGPAHAPEDD